jgi:hypothetical protein
MTNHTNSSERTNSPTTRKCATIEMHHKLLKESEQYKNARIQIESMTNEYLTSARIQAERRAVKIPVVVHVVWNTEEQNISDEQIHSQIDVLNLDFRATNPDIANVPSAFNDLVSDAKIEFFLASKDSNGNVTTGITRTHTTQQSFAINDSVKSKNTGGTNPWPADKYLNIWVCQLEDGLLGYAQFPGGPPKTDGVVIGYKYFGTTGTATEPFHLGRTATHEIGHWFNLFHIGGDDRGACNGSDRVADTPNQADQNTKKPIFPHISCDNGPNGDMFMNYMDYVDDDTMVMFTKDQVARMDACLEGPRSSFLNS